MHPTLSLEIADTTQIASARRAAAEMAVELGFDEQDTGRAALLATEAATNLLKHAGRGEMLLSPAFDAVPSLTLTALDKGPGFHVPRALEDGYSTTGTMGGGLGAMQRMSSEFQVYSRPGRGSVVRMVLRRTGEATPRPGAFQVAGVAVPYPGELVCGDAWSAHDDGHSTLLTVADGLGHGLEARKASVLAIDALHALNPDTAPGQPAHRRPADVVASAHGALRGTRGAAMATALIDPERQLLHYAGIGNIAGMVVTPEGQKHLMSLAGIVGHNVRKIQPQEHPWTPASVLVMYSDGLASHWHANEDPELMAQHPGIVSAALYRDHRRGRDDATVLVVRQSPPAAPARKGQGSP